MEAQLPDVHNFIRNMLSDSKILCLAAPHDNILMWSHYADHHTGAVLRFKTDGRRMFFALRGL